MRTITETARRSRRWWIIGATVAALLAILIWNARREETYEHAMRTIATALENGDAQTVLSYMDKKEIEQVGITESSLRRLLNEYYRPAIGSFERDYNVSLKQGEPYMHGEIVYKGRDAKLIGLAQQMKRESGGINMASLTERIVWTAMLAKVPPGEPVPLQRQKLTYLLKRFSEDQGALGRTGVPGMMSDFGDGYQFYTWADIVKEMELSIQRYDARQASIR
jgi:hypothetical protein